MSMGIYRGSLTSLCEKLQVDREDNCQHQAGSDSKVTAKCFFALKNQCDGSVEACKGNIFGYSQINNDILLPKLSTSI